jgi:hypothetical protein
MNFSDTATRRTYGESVIPIKRMFPVPWSGPPLKVELHLADSELLTAHRV